VYIWHYGAEANNPTVTNFTNSKNCTTTTLSFIFFRCGWANCERQYK